MDPRDELAPDQLEFLNQAFSDQLQACLEECARGRRGLFSTVTLVEDEQSDGAWPEAARLRELALALENVFAQHQQCHALSHEFLDLCSIHGESHPGESRLARMFLTRIERGEVGTPTEEPRKPW